MKAMTLFATLATATLLCATPSFAQQHHGNSAATTASKSAPHNGMPGMAQGDMGEKCAMMTQMHQTMQSANKAQDARLQQLTDAMNQASGDQKTNAMAAVITELVAQRSARAQSADQMQSQMMTHMGEHMMQGDSASMMRCPMMSGKMAGMTKPGMTMPKNK